MFPEMREDIHVIEVAVDELQVLETTNIIAFIIMKNKENTLKKND